MRFHLFACVSIAFSILAFAGCSDDSSAPGDAESPAVTPVNMICPMMGDPVDEAVTVQWNGKIIGFCCADCIPGWNELSDEEKATKLAAADEQPATDHDHAHQSASPDTE